LNKSNYFFGSNHNIENNKNYFIKKLQQGFFYNLYDLKKIIKSYSTSFSRNDSVFPKVITEEKPFSVNYIVAMFYSYIFLPYKILFYKYPKSSQPYNRLHQDERIAMCYQEIYDPINFSIEGELFLFPAYG